MSVRNRQTGIGLLLLIGCVCLATSLAQRPQSTKPELGIRDRAPRKFAITGATIVTSAGDSIESGTIVIDNGLIVAVGPSMDPPADARVIEMEGKTIYPGLLDAYTEVKSTSEQAKTAHWNKHALPERRIADGWSGGKSKEDLRKAGFTTQLIVPDNGVLKGTSAIVALGDKNPSDSIVRNDVAQHLRLTRPNGATRDYYPRSPMGAVALARQSFYDAKWYDDAWRAHGANGDVSRPESNAALAALGRAITNDGWFIFEANDEQYVLRAQRFAVEFGLNRVAVRGSGREYQRLDAIAKTGYPMILPVAFPKPPNVATPEAARDATLASLMHWHLAPENPARLHEAGVRFALTTHGLKSPDKFREKLRQAVERGLDPDTALAACTSEPAKLFGIADKVGSIAKGKAANLMICDGDWLGKKTKVVETWVDGVRFEHSHAPTNDLAGVWQISAESPVAGHKSYYLQLKDKEGNGKLSGTVSLEKPKEEEKKEPADESTEEAAEKDDEATDDSDDAKKEKEEDKPKQAKLEKLSSSFGRISGRFAAKPFGEAKGTIRLSATAVGDEEAVLYGEFLDESSTPIGFTAKRLEKAEEDSDDSADDESESDESEKANDEEKSDEDSDNDGDKKGDNGEDGQAEPLEVAVNYPAGIYGVANPNRKPGTVQINNATIWTCGPEGILENASVVVSDGKIVAVGKDLPPRDGAEQIDAKGKHVTPGIIDCHSHMATDGGVNEGTQAITAEVRIGDFIDATDITIYRQLAGGVTAANVLHGSANPIGGQNQVIKLRWGRLPEEMKFAEAPQGIKFALGENVKQSNWGDEYRSRYPQTRMGVEQISRDAFHAAKEYERQWAEWKKNRQGLPPRKDLELDAVLEIVNGTRWIHCHSYRQDEILGLIRTLDDFDITIGTFQHILEGYKVTKEMAEHGAMGSSFSDWWAYKIEVYDAIPYNGALMHDAGIVVSFNSDDAELGRHLNHEAAKAVKYGGVSREEALKFVTLNAAKQLRIDQYVGSLEAGKHADIAVWSGDPLQVTSRCEQTWIDGIPYFELEADKAMHDDHESIRRKLMQHVLDSGESMMKPGERNHLLREMFPRHDEYCGHHGHGHGGHEHE